MQIDNGSAPDTELTQTDALPSRDGRPGATAISPGAGKVFDDESDRWITRLEGETDRDALLRNRALTAKSSRPFRQPTRTRLGRVNPHAVALWIIGVTAAVIGLIMRTSAMTMLDDGVSSVDDAAASAAAGAIFLAAGFLAILAALLLSGIRWAMDNALSPR